ncbi:ROK family transcriptional regulator [Clostridioides difficile]|uniref:ROK family transcriptional regulator n=3 Tax=Clostridioides difficile TaxID=1496 RepID=A0AAX3GX35_CLODI|nr:hypothetical protein HMPREF0220_2589 [Clostridioides difficile NAP08]EFH15975.1 hypothetical protein HMPREF0219_1379 [Clostridioides difficile NAP07]OMK40617.1 hypothetical protein BER34_002257 [Clostridioides difficile]CCK90401.1 putative sugar metabolism repressor [Clostridioides difficile T5]CCK93797.1 putative sugar metabolism repressor [Clostridioides difficile T20]CCK97537.1 putative sugar metabolism repressor [Clostridioides difficile E1]CCK97922.1 putative sugar metabolism represso
MALMYLENGIGSGIVINDELYLGSTNFAGELNYLNIEFGKYNSNNLNLEEYMYLVYLVVILLMTIRL